uniref:Uncharacterized protein n=1 Tax=Anguilla anguilla TaxID=7936 RepID=A0A0E9PPG8_ANGAN
MCCYFFMWWVERTSNNRGHRNGGVENTSHGMKVPSLEASRRRG